MKRLLPALLLAACTAGGPGTTRSTADVGAVPVRDPGSSLGSDWKLGPFAELYVRGYRDSDADGIGDLRGVTEKLDYLRDLGVTGIWLMPVTSSEDKDHGYAVTDYRAIEPQYGTMADFDELLRQAHARGMGVIIDYVINHSAGEHPLFLDARSSATSARRDWYVWSTTKPEGWSVFGRDPWYPATGGYYYAAFWIGMPEFNLRNPEVVEYHRNNLRFWLNRGVDGFRFDAVGNLVENGPDGWRLQPETYDVMAKMRETVAEYGNRYMVCEAPDDPIGFGRPSACGGSFAFDHNKAILRAVHGDTAAARDVVEYFVDAPAGMATMLANHDAFAGERVWDQVGGDLTKYKLAAATYLLQPGVPFVYYGEEIGMAGGAGLSGDHRLRSPMSWTGDTVTAGFTTGTPFRAPSANVATRNVRAEPDDPLSLLAFYRGMIALRRSRPSLARGTYERPTVSGLAIAFQRSAGRERSLVAINYGPTEARVRFEGLPPGAGIDGVLPRTVSAIPVDRNGQFVLMVPAHAVFVFGLTR